MTNTQNLIDNTISAKEPASFTKIDRDDIRNALIKLGIKSHDDVFEIGPNMDYDTTKAISTAIAAYVQFLAQKNFYRDAITVDYQDDTEAYLEAIYAVIESFQDIDKTYARMKYVSLSGEIPYGAYDLHSLTQVIIDYLVRHKDLSSFCNFLFGPQESFFTENLTDNDKAQISVKPKVRIPLYDNLVISKGIYLAKVYRVSMIEKKYLYFGYEIEQNGVLRNSCLAPNDFVKEDENIQAGLKALGFVKTAPKNNECYTDDETRKIFDDVNEALAKVNNLVYVRAVPNSNRTRICDLQYISNLKQCEEIFSTPAPNDILVNEFQTEEERNDVATKLVNFMTYAQNKGKKLTFDYAQYASDKDGHSYEDRINLKTYMLLKFSATKSKKTKALLRFYKAEIKKNFFNLTNLDNAKEQLAHMAKYRPGSYTLFDIANICGCYSCTTPKGNLWGCVSECRFERDFTPEYEFAKKA